MHKSLVVVIALLAATLSLEGCLDTSSENQEVAADPQIETPLPHDYKEQILDRLHQTLRDPYSVKSAAISAPHAITDANGRPVWLVCVQMNAKNGFGAYTGIKTTDFEFRNGELGGLGTPIEMYAQACEKFNVTDYTPWPTLGS